MFQFYSKGLPVIIVVIACAGFAYSQRIKAVPDPDSAGVLTVKKAGSDLPSGDLADKVDKDGSGKSTLRMSADKRYEASVFCVASGSAEVTDCVHRVFITDLQSEDEYEIVGEELFIEAGRLIDNLKWINNHTISYDRWAGPHFGHRYVVDIQTKKQTGAFALSDQ